MDFSANNVALWNLLIQFGFIAAAIIVANTLRRKLPFVRNSLMPTAVLAGFLLLLLRSLGVLRMDLSVLQMVTYHGIALGFIAMSLQIHPDKGKSSGDMTGAKSGALIVSSYLIQAIAGLLITLLLAYTIMPDLFKAAGILLPMGYGQGPGQANNVGGTYETLGFIGGRSFGLSLAASGYLVACIVGVFALNILIRRGHVQRIRHEELSGSVTVETFQDTGEIPLNESLDKFSMQAALCIFAYLLTYLVIWGTTSLLSAVSPGVSGMVSPLLWGFNFIIGSLVGLGVKQAMKHLRGSGLMTRQYQNNYLLSRISGLAFDVMIVAGIASIEIADLSGLWLPFLLLSAAGTIVSWIYLSRVCRRLYPDYYYEGLMSMYGMMTGTISSGILLLREIDPEFKTPAAGNLVLGSSFGIGFGIPILILVGLAPKSDFLCWLTLALCVVYFLLLLGFIYKAHRKKK